MGVDSMNRRFKKDPDADPNCVRCHGYGEVDISGNMCYGMGAQPKMGECSCILYKKLNIKKKPKLEKCIHGGPIDKCKGACGISVKVENTNTFLFCILDKKHKGPHEVYIKELSSKSL